MKKEKASEEVFNYKIMRFLIFVPIILFFFFGIGLLIAYYSKASDVLSIIICSAFPLLALGLLAFLLRNQLVKTVFSLRGVESKSMKKKSCIEWKEVEFFAVKYRKVSWWRKDFFVLSVCASEKIINIEFSAQVLNDLKRKLIRFCPRQDLIKSAEAILDKNYILAKQ